MLVFLIYLFSSSNGLAESHSSLIAQLKNYESKKDFLGARIITKRLAKYQLNYSEWLKVRQLLFRRPAIGYNILFKWDDVPFTTNRSEQVKSSEQKMNDWLKTADEEMLSENFEGAFAKYQKAAAILKKDSQSGHNDNRLLYQTTIHNMARALYGAGRFDDALTVYGWVSKDYPKYRQILFEKMWAAFRGDHADVALGAIASQQSTYFSDYMEPESYLAELYIYKKLCRAEEQKTVRSNIIRFKHNLSSGKFTYTDWAKSDVETYGLLRLSQQPPPEEEDHVVGLKERQREQEFIKKLLETRYERERVRLLNQLNNVLAYSYLAVSAKSLALKETDIDVKRLRVSGQEYWPVDDAEDWLDEIGGHLYIGKSQCIK